MRKFDFPRELMISIAETSWREEKEMPWMRYENFTIEREITKTDGFIKRLRYRAHTRRNIQLELVPVIIPLSVNR